MLPDTTAIDIDAELVRRLIAAQFPEWAHLPVSKVEPGGWDNRTFRLGDELSVRLPSAAAYAEQVAKEQAWLPRLAPRLPLPIPAPVALGSPTGDYPWPWSVVRWLAGERAELDRIADLPRFATELAEFLVALERIDPTDGPPPGTHNFHRGGSLTVYDVETRQSLAILAGEIDGDAASDVWETALRASWHGPPVWLHGDVAAGNLLVNDGRLSAVIDFGCMAVGDPASDMTIAWTLFTGESREAFTAGRAVDDATWARGRGWALWKALITIVGARATDPAIAHEARRVLSEVIADHRSRA